MQTTFSPNTHGETFQDPHLFNRCSSTGIIVLVSTQNFVYILCVHIVLRIIFHSKHLSLSEEHFQSIILKCVIIIIFSTIYRSNLKPFPRDYLMLCRPQTYVHTSRTRVLFRIYLPVKMR